MNSLSKMLFQLQLNWYFYFLRDFNIHLWERKRCQGSHRCCSLALLTWTQLFKGNWDLTLWSLKLCWASQLLPHLVFFVIITAHVGPFSELCFRYLKEMFPPRRAHICAQHSSTAGLCCLSEEYTAIVPVFTLDTLHRWPNGAVAAQLALARNPEGSVCRNKQ